MRYLIILLLFTSLHVHGQENPSVRDKWAIKITPSSLLDPKGAQIPIGVEYGVGKAVTVTLEGAIPLLYRPFNNTLLSKGDIAVKDDYKVRVEMKYLFPVEDDNSQTFVGWEFTYRHQEYHVNSPSDYRSGDINVSYAEADISRKRFTLSTIVGSRLYLFHSIYLEGFMGLGLKQLEVWHSNLVSPREKYVGRQYFGSDAFENTNHSEGVKLGLYATAGLKIAVLLN